MLDLSPTKLLIIFVVVVVLLGPKRLPGVARQLGAAWRKVREFHGQIDRELRQTMPDLPTSHDIVRFARSPITLLNQLADRPDDGADPSARVGPAPPDGSSPLAASLEEEGGPGASTMDGNGHASGAERAGRSAFAVPSFAGLDTDDPNLN